MCTEGETVSVYSGLYFVSTERELPLFDLVDLSAFPAVFPVDSTRVLNVNYDEVANDLFYRVLQGGLHGFLTEVVGVHSDPHGAFQKRFYTNPCMGFSLQELDHRLSGPEYLAVPPCSFHMGEQVPVMVYRLYYNLDRVSERLEELTATRNCSGSSLYRLSLEQQIDTLLENVRREIPLYIPNY